MTDPERTPADVLAELRAAIAAEAPTPRQKALRGVAAVWALFMRPRGTAAILEAQGQAFSAAIRAIAGPVPRCLCEHTRAEHSQQLADAPCLECACPAWMVKG